MDDNVKSNDSDKGRVWIRVGKGERGSLDTGRRTLDSIIFDMIQYHVTGYRCRYRYRYRYRCRCRHCRW